MGSARLEVGDCRELSAGLDMFSIDAVITDPPYGLEFMGKGWDGVVPGADFWRSVKRTMKPGAHLLAFGGTRTHHRLMVAIEDAGFEIRDCLMWLYGSGFPKSLDVSKAIDKAAGAEREIIGVRQSPDGNPRKRGTSDKYAQDEWTTTQAVGFLSDTAPATDAARDWDGWGTALKPAWEPIILARRPLVGTVAGNVQEYRTGALNIDGCRIDHNGDIEQHATPSKSGLGAHGVYGSSTREQGANSETRYHETGRWPANIMLDEDAAAMLDAQSGERKSGGMSGSYKGAGNGVAYGQYGFASREIEANTGGASRFFYTAKASRAERGEGNTHPTVKPISLMRWLARLITPPGGTILDPFMGSGSTGCAAVLEGFDFVGFDISEEYVEIARRRIAHWEDVARAAAV